ncbi:hypothetical protein [Phytohabitans kaempferiae]|uniref:Uncharacterized protein n=1 Tax=Phytohabitans kaempferiae TaxID=1620943 RepID=A0ABV6LXL5_9ACTN
MNGRLPPPASTASQGRPDHRRIDGLFDIWLRTGADGRPVAVRGTGAPLDAGQLAALVRRGGGAGDDVRIMMDGAEEHVRIFAELAGILGRDVHISPVGSRLRYDGDAALEPTLVDARTDRPVEWLVVQPPAMATDLPGWYETTNGVLRPRSGVVTAPLPGGLTLATRADFVARRAAAVDLAAGHPELTTIGVSVRGGGFVVGDYTGSYEVTGGRQLAAALATVPLYGGEVRMWLHWPSDPEERERLHGNLAAFAENTGAIVWAPERTAAVEILDSCQDLSAVDRAGGPAAWRTYLPPMAGTPRFESDQDGRLSPAGRMVVSTYPGAPLVSVAPARQRAMSSRYSGLRAQHGLFRIDLTILPDGRWAVQYADSGPHALGPRVLQRMLRTAGWQGEDLLLLASYPARAEAGVRRYGSRLVEGLRAEVWVLPPEAGFDSSDGVARAVDDRGRPVAWQRLDPDDSQWRWQSDDGVLVAADPGGRPAVTGEPTPAPTAAIRQPAPQRPAPRQPLSGRSPAADLTAAARPSVAEAAGSSAAEQAAASVPASPVAWRRRAGEPPQSVRSGPQSPGAARSRPHPPPAGRTPTVVSGPVSPVPVHSALPPPAPPAGPSTARPSRTQSSPGASAPPLQQSTASSAAAQPVPDRGGGWLSGRSEPTRVVRPIAEPQPVVGPIAEPRPVVGPRPLGAPGTAARPAAARPEIGARPLAPAGVDLPVSDAPRLGTVRRPVRHGIYWLAERPTVNAEPVELYVVGGCSPADAANTGVPTPHLFLVGTLRPPVPAALREGEHLLRVRILAGGAVDISSITVHEPPALHDMLLDRDESYLLPGGLLGRTRLVAGYGVDASGEYAVRATFPTGPPLALRCVGAAHGIDGLPADLPRWPYDADATAYALLRDPRATAPKRAMVLLRGRPRARRGRLLVQLRVRWRCAIDVRATAAQIADLPQVRSTAGPMSAAGAGLLLPRDAHEQVEVVRVLAAGRLGWRTVSEPAVPLAEFLAGRADGPGHDEAPAGTRPGPN